MACLDFLKHPLFIFCRQICLLVVRSFGRCALLFRYSRPSKCLSSGGGACMHTTQFTNIANSHTDIHINTFFDGVCVYQHVCLCALTHCYYFVLESEFVYVARKCVFLRLLVCFANSIFLLPISHCTHSKTVAILLFKVIRCYSRCCLLLLLLCISSGFAGEMHFYNLLSAEVLPSTYRIWRYYTRRHTHTCSFERTNSVANCNPPLSTSNITLLAVLLWQHCRRGESCCGRRAAFHSRLFVRLFACV